MPTPDPNNVLFEIAHPDLYERNPFNVLNLPVTATAKDIRRRREDIELAFDTGMETEVFANTIPRSLSHKTPTRAEVAELFASLENPEERLAWELFWFWETPEIALPTNKQGRIVGNPNGRFTQERFRDWLLAVKDEDETRDIETLVHNLAIAYHVSCLSGDWQLVLEFKADTPEHRDAVWKSAIRYWNRAVASDDFWHAFVDRTTDLDDPRVGHKTIRRFRDQFAFAFDQINVELAIDFAKTGRADDAKRQIKYMELSQPDSDDVEGTFENAFSRLLRQTEAIVSTAVSEAKTAPKDGIRLANGILRQTEEPLQVSRIVFEKGAPVRNAIVASIFRGVHNCLVAFGNEVKDWRECLKLTETLAFIAETPEQKRTIETDLGMLKALADNQAKREHCWCCGAKMNESKGDGFKTFHLWGKMRLGSKLGAVKYQTRRIEVPVCKKCDNERWLTFGSRFHRVESYPELVQANEEGFVSGEGPSQDQIQAFWGF